MCFCPLTILATPSMISSTAMAAVVDDVFNDPVVYKSLGFAAVQGLLSVLLAYLLARRCRPVTNADKVGLLWLVYSGMVHFTLEAYFLYASLTSTVLESEGFFADIWKQYTKADYRWGVSDPTIVALELLTVTSNGTLTVILIFAILYKKPYRHFVQVVLNVCELYGGWMTFAPEWLTGSKNLDTSNWLYLWVYLAFFNSLWVVGPGLLLVQSYVAISSQTKQKRQ